MGAPSHKNRLQGNFAVSGSKHCLQGNFAVSAQARRPPTVLRARRATANPTLTVLKAALNHAFHDGRISSDETWPKVTPCREVAVPVVHFLSEGECRRIVNA